MTKMLLLCLALIPLPVWAEFSIIPYGLFINGIESTEDCPWVLWEWEYTQYWIWNVCGE